jgi:hypothetical protein
MILRLTDGTTTINLTGGTITLANPYMPAAPKGDADISESVEVTITGVNAAAVQTQVRAIEALLVQAREYQESKVSGRVWVEFRWDSSGTVYRSELKDGRIEPDKNTGRAAHRAIAAIQALVAWQRVPYWEGAEENLPLANDHNYVGGTTGMHVYNRFDPTYTAVSGEVIKTANGLFTYTGTFAHAPVKRGSVVVTFTIGGAPKTATDDGYGVISGNGATGTIVYSTGAWTLVYDPAVDVQVTGDHIDDGDGSTVSFSGPLTYGNVVATTVRIRYTQGGANLASNYDDGAGSIAGPTPFNVGTLVYVSGVWNTGYDFDAGSPPDNLTPIYADYRRYTAVPDYGTNITAAYSYLSAGNINYVDVLAVDIDGVLPTPAIVNVQNEGASTYKFFIGHNVFSDPANLAHFLDASGTVDAANCNGGEYHDITLTGSEAKLDAWYLYPADDWAGAWFQIIARFRTAPTAGTRVRVRVGYGSTGTPLIIANAPWKELGTDLIQELGAVRLPPWQASAYSTPAVVLALYGYITSGSGTLELDFLQTTPTDSYRAYRPGQSGVYVDNLHELVDDGVEDQVYHLSAGGIPYGDYVPYGKKIMLWPGRLNRLYFLVTEASTAPIAHDSHVFVKYRQRRATL